MNLFQFIDLTQESHRRVSVGAAMKGNFVVSQSDLWDTHTLSHAKQRQSPRNHPNPQRCQEHAHSVPHEQNSLHQRQYNEVFQKRIEQNIGINQKY